MVHGGTAPTVCASHQMCTGLDTHLDTCDNAPMDHTGLAVLQRSLLVWQRSYMFDGLVNDLTGQSRNGSPIRSESLQLGIKQNNELSSSTNEL